MPRKWKKIEGKKHRNRVNPQQLEKAMEAVRKGMTQTDAAKKFNIERTILSRRIKKPNIGPHSGPVSAISPELEQLFCKRFITSAEWGYPLETKEIQKVIGEYLNLKEITIPLFKNNVPGMDYVRAFLERHKSQLSHRLASNIKRARAAVDYDCIESFFENIAVELADVPEGNIFNYDETNFTDDPGTKKVICKRTAKYVERVMNSTKTSTSVMFVGSAGGQILPPYIVYKASHLYNTWTEGGPQDARYNRSQNGWFDSTTFIDWLETIIIPHLRRLEGKKYIIGDNLSAHISLQAIEVCEMHDIHFIFLPSNATHLLQPLDVAVFSSLKKNWREILTDWKKGPGQTETSIPKGIFPSLLKKLLEKVSGRMEENIKSGFKKCGIFPLNPNEVFSRLPPGSANPRVNEQSVDDVLTNHLKSLRSTTPAVRQKKKKNSMFQPEKAFRQKTYGSKILNQDLQVLLLHHRRLQHEHLAPNEVEKRSRNHKQHVAMKQEAAVKAHSLNLRTRNHFQRTQTQTNLIIWG